MENSEITKSGQLPACDSIPKAGKSTVIEIEAIRQKQSAMTHFVWRRDGTVTRGSFWEVVFGKRHQIIAFNVRPQKKINCSKVAALFALS